MIIFPPNYRAPSKFMLLALISGLLLMANPAFAQLEMPEGDEYSANDFGGIGLMQTRTARFAPDGQLNMGASFLNPYRKYFIMWQILPSVEVTFRYVDPTNTDVSTGAIFDQTDGKFFSDIFHFRNGNTRLDRGFDIKIKLFEETKFRPALAVGFQDFIGTGLFAGEYIVASKAFGRFDVSLGIGWGHVGSKGHISNPFKVFGSHFDKRNGFTGFGGELSVGDFFAGDRAAFFGGVEYFSPIEGLSVKVEYNGSDPEKYMDIRPEFEHLGESLPIGFALNYRAAPWFDMTVGYERGNALMLRGVFRTNLNRPGIVKKPMPEPKILQRDELVKIEDELETTIIDQYQALRRTNIESAPTVNENSEDQNAENEAMLSTTMSEEDAQLLQNVRDKVDNNIFNIIQNQLASSGFWAYGLQVEGDTATLYLSKTLYSQTTKNVGYAARLIHNLLPSEVEKITIVELVANIEIARVSIIRSDIEKEARYYASAEDIWFNAEVEIPQSGLPNEDTAIIATNTYPASSWWVAPELSQHLGDIYEGVYLADLDMEVGYRYSPIPGLSFSVVGRQYIFGKLDTIKRKSDSVLPHVRSDIVEYLQNGRTSIKTMQVDYIGSLKPNWYYRIAAGLFEPMFGGVGAEVLYRPYGKPWALSVELDWAKQRGYKQLLDFRDYAVVTGHATLNYDLPFFGMRTTISAGRYLAGDYGMTFEVSRRFDNGVRVGGFFTKTNVSAADFGEGSFDKGFYIKFPFDAFLSKHSKQEANFLFRPLTRDGGQKLGIGPSLFELVDRGNYKLINKYWDKIGKRSR